VRAPDRALAETVTGTWRLDSGDHLRITEDGPGFRVSAEGPDAVARLFPIPAGFEADVERQQRRAQAVIEGASADGRRELDHLRVAHGEITGTELVGSIAGDVTTTLFEATFQPPGSASSQLVGVSLNRFGGNEGVGLTPWPQVVFVVDASGHLVPHGAGPDDQRLSLAPVPGGVELTGPDGTVVAAAVAAPGG
jgi:hypothetical protein